MAKRKRDYEGQITCTAESNGRPVTLDPIRSLTLALPARQVESTLSCGFRTDWASGTNGKKKFELLVGAGVGSPYMIFEYDGKSYITEVKAIVQAFITEIDKEASHGDKVS